MADAIIPGDSIELEVSSVPTINFAMHQNDVPLVREVRITNKSSQAVENIQVSITSEPELFPAWATTVASVPPGGTYGLGVIDLRLSAVLLAGLTERISGRVRADIHSNGQILATCNQPIVMLAYDEWNGLAYSMPELLAAFVLPNHPGVEAVLADAAKWLGERTGDSSLSGYQSRSPARVGKITQAVFSALQARGLTYCNPPASFERTGQRVRLPDQMLENKLATCLDLSVFISACLEQAGLNPLVILKDGHAFAGVWLINECFADPGTDDILPLRKRVDLNEILVFETTRITSPPPNDFGSAVEAGKRHLRDEDQFGCVIDIARCRKSGIRPLPVRVPVPEAPGDVHAAEVITAGAVFELPQKAAPAAREADTPATRLDRWKRKLLDLSLHNRLINFKESKKTIPLLCPDLTTLEDSLAEGNEFKIMPRPREFGPEANRNEELHRLRTGDDAMNRLLRSELDARRLRAGLTDDELQRRLIEVYRAGRTAMEEGGASAMYLALGFLSWYQSDQSEVRRLAPIILIPVELHRNSVQEGFKFSQSDEEPRINITLLELLSKDFGLKVENMDPIPEDDHGIDVAGILTAFRLAIKDINRWDVLDEAQLGFFSFTKFLMWRDLEQRTEDLLKNKVVNHLVNHANEPFPGDGQFPVIDTLDEDYRPTDTFCPLPADSSQLAAVYAAASPKSFVMFGPPGTGKSQTITNLIAHTLASNKSVLFVSEKIAALNVVHHRLSECGLEPFCLELHSHKTNKQHVIDQLGRAIDVHANTPPQDWAREANRLADLRAELNAYARALHQPRSFGQSVFQGLSLLTGLRDARRLDLKLADPAGLTRDQLERWRDLIQQMRVAGDACGLPGQNVWTGSSLEEWSPATQRSIEAELRTVQDLCSQLEEHAGKLGPQIGLGKSWNLPYFAFAEKFLQFLVDSPEPAAGLLLEPDWPATETVLNKWIKVGRERDGHREALYSRYEPDIVKLDLDQLAGQASKAQSAWFLPRWLGTRAIRRQLAAVTKGTSNATLETLTKDISIAQALRDCDRQMDEAQEQATALLGNYWHDGEADWNAIESLRDWCRGFHNFVGTVGGKDAKRADAARNLWTKLVTENHDALRKDGAWGKAITSYVESYAEFTKAKSRLEGLLAADESFWGVDARRATLDEIRARLTGWRSEINRLSHWCNWRRVRRQVVEAGLSPLVTAYEAAEIPSSALAPTFERSFYEWWTEAIIDGEPSLSRFFSPEHERKIEQFRQLDKGYTELTHAEIHARLASRRPPPSDRVSQNSEMGILNRQRQLRRRHMPVRQLFQKIPHLLHQLKPCVLMSPISVAQYLDAEHPPFDLVVFDEASQVPVWDAIGAIARGQEVVIAGDPKQLPPTTFFMRADDPDAPADDLADLQDMESILDDCLAARLPTMPLRWHYRSRHESLIAFSNFHYYDNSLHTFPSPHLDMGVSYRHVPDGVYDRSKSRTNRAEAEAIVADVVHRLRDPHRSGQSIGVVTFSMAQQGLIEDLLDDARRSYPEIEPHFGEDAREPVFVKNLENVQGDERDVILMSICYGPDAEGRVSMNFGPVNREGGERRLNVAITRARIEVVVFAALRAEQIDLSRTRARGAQDLKCFLDYAERGPVAIAQALTLSGGAEFDSPFEQEVCERLRACGHEVHTQVGCSGYRIDLAIVDPAAAGWYLLGIECDGANYHSAKTARDRDQLRQSVLTGLGWRLHRVWSSDWWRDPDECLAKINAAIEESRTAPTRKPDPPPPAASREVIRSESGPPPAPLQPQRSSFAGPSAIDPVAKYRAYSQKKSYGAPDRFHQQRAEKTITRLVEQIVEEEGPVALDVLSRRVAAHWGIGRLVASVRERVARLAHEAGIRFTEQPHGVFLWPMGLQSAKYCSFRAPGVCEEDRRDITEIPMEEIVAAALHVLRHQVSLPKDDLIRETAMLLGFQRAGATIQRVVGQGVELAAERQSVSVDAQGRVRLNQ